MTDWITKHNAYASLESRELLNVRLGDGHSEIAAKFFGSQAGRKRWLRNRVWNRMPPLIRPFAYFFYRYVLAGGFLDGAPAFMYHFLQGLWFPMLVDIKYLELRRWRPVAPVALAEPIPQNDPHVGPLNLERGCVS